MQKLSDWGKAWDDYFDAQNIDIDQLWEDIYEAYVEYLEPQDVVLPKYGTASMYQLVYLFAHLGEEVPKDEVSLFVIRNLPGVALDQQTRHLREDGWQVYAQGAGYVLASVTSPVESFNKARRHTRLSDADFEWVKQNYLTEDGRYYCPTCWHFGRATIEGEPIPGRSWEVCALQQGHLDSNLPLSADNCIPQCQICNRSATNRYKFDRDGIPYDVNTGEEMPDYWRY